MTNGKSGRTRRRGRGLVGAANAIAIVAAGVLTTDAARGQVDVDCAFTHGTTGSMAPAGAGVLFTFNDVHTVLTCERFNIMGPDGVTFVRAGGGTDARILARVNDLNGSMINGPLNATGTLYLVNPAGVVFGPNSRVVADGFYAAAADIDVDQYLLGNSVFDTSVNGGLVEVVEGGQILAQDVVHLIGRRVANHGSISASGAFSGGGVVTMVAAHDSITISEDMEGRISVRIGMDELTRDLVREGSGLPDLTGDVGVENTGSIRVNGGGGQVVLGAGNLAGLAIANRGTIEALGGGGSVQATALGGTVLHAGAIHASDVAMTGDAIQLDTDVDADVAQFNDATYVGGAVTIRGLDGTADEVRFVSTVDGTSDPEEGGDGASALDVQSDLARFEGTVGGQSRLGTLNVSGDAVVGGDVVTRGDATFGGDVEADGAGNQQLDSSDGDLAFGGDLEKTTDGDLGLRGRTITSGGDTTTFSGDIDFDGNAVFDGGAHQVVSVGGGFPHEIRFGGDATKTTAGTLQLIGRDILFDAAAGVDQTLSAVDALDLDGRVQRTMAGDLDVEATSIALGDDVFTIVGDLSIDGEATFDGDGDQSAFAGSSGALAFSGNVSKTTGGNLALAGGGGVSIPGNVNVAGGSLLVEDDLAFGGSSVQTAGAQTYEGNVTLGSDAAFIGTAVSFDEDVIGAGHDLTVVGAATFGDSGDIDDEVVGVQDLLVDGTTRVNARRIETAGTQTYNDEVTLGTDVTMSGSAVAFGGAIDGAGNDLTVNAVTTTFGGDVAGVAHLETDAAGTTFIGGDISVSDGVRFNDAVMLQNNVALVDGSTTGVIFASTVDGGFSFSVRTDGDALFQADVGALQTLGRFETIVEGTLIFQGSLVRAAGDVVLNEQVSIEVPATATIGVHGNLSIESLNGSFRMGQNQKLTVLGNLSISALSQAVLGDINTLGDMSVSASDIVLLLRDGSVVVTPSGDFVGDQGLDFVAGGQFFFSVTPRAIGDGFVQFASSSLSGDVATLRGFVVRTFNGAITPDRLLPGSGPLAGTFLDLTATGAASTNLAEAFDADAPGADDGDPLSDAILSPIIRQTLSQFFAIVPRDLRPGELNEIPEGRTFYRDQQETGVAIPGGGRIFVAVNRLGRVNAHRAVALWQQLTGYDPATGTYTRPPAAIAADIAVFWNDYTAAIGSSPSPSGVAASLPASLTDELMLLIALLDQIRLMGLTDSEMQVPLNAIVAQFTPDEVGVARMRAMLAALR